MANEKLTRIKRFVCRLDWGEFTELEKWLRKRRDKMWLAERLKRKKEHEDSIKALPVGTNVVYTDSRSNLCGKTGKIVRHLERNSNRTVVDFGIGDGIWRIPRNRLSANISQESLNSLKTCKNLSRVLNKALGSL